MDAAADRARGTEDRDRALAGRPVCGVGQPGSPGGPVALDQFHQRVSLAGTFNAVNGRDVWMTLTPRAVCASPPKCASLSARP
jgi:hypothetical protein